MLRVKWKKILNCRLEPSEQRVEYFELNRIDLIQNMQTRLTRPQEQVTEESLQRFENYIYLITTV